VHSGSRSNSGYWPQAHSGGLRVPPLDWGAHVGVQMRSSKSRVAFEREGLGGTSSTLRTSCPPSSWRGRRCPFRPRQGHGDFGLDRRDTHVPLHDLAAHFKANRNLNRPRPLQPFAWVPKGSKVKASKWHCYKQGMMFQPYLFVASENGAKAWMNARSTQEGESFPVAFKLGECAKGFARFGVPKGSL
jgi:hypothetical protein